MENSVLRIRSVRVLMVIFLAFILLLTCAQTASAEPNPPDQALPGQEPAGNAEDPSKTPLHMEDGWVEIKATVPEGFSGTVSVQLLRVEDSSYHVVSCHDYDGYSNGSHLPLGEYTVERAYTSEDSLIYEAFIELDAFVLEGTQALDVKVEYSAAGESYFHSPGTEESVTSPTISPEIQVEDRGEPGSEHTDTGVSVDESKDEPKSAPDDPNEEAEEPSTFMKVAKRICIAIAGTGIFVLLVFVSVYLLRRYYLDE